MKIYLIIYSTSHHRSSHGLTPSLLLNTTTIPPSRHSIPQSKRNQRTHMPPPPQLFSKRDGGRLATRKRGRHNQVSYEFLLANYLLTRDPAFRHDEGDMPLVVSIPCHFDVASHPPHRVSFSLTRNMSWRLLPANQPPHS